MRSFPANGAARVSPEEYEELIRSSRVKIGGAPGDTNFAWIYPEASNVDNAVVDELVREGFIPGQYVAAVTAADLREPVLSMKRKSLMRFLPATYEVKAAEPPHALDIAYFQEHDLTKKTIAALEAAALPSGSPEERFLRLLKMTDGSPMDVLAREIEAYASEIKSRLANGATTRQAELKRLHELAIQRRTAVLRDPVLGRLDETGGTLLLPTP